MTVDTKHFRPSKSRGALHVAFEIAQRYQLTSLHPLIQSCFKLAERNELSIAVIGRFKAGKSSFLNSFLQREVLPVGVIPVTTVITEIAYGPTAGFGEVSPGLNTELDPKIESLIRVVNSLKSIVIR